MIRAVFVSLATFLVLGSTFAISVLAWRVDRQYVTTSSAEAAPEPQRPGSELQSAVRSFPLHTDRAVFSGPVDSDALEKQLLELGAQLGLEGWLPGLASTAMDQYQRESEELPYPYEYSDLDDTIASNLKASVVAEDPGLVLDLAALAVTGAANAETRSGFDYMKAGGVLAYSVLRRALEVHPTCDLQLQLVHLVTLGYNARDSAISAEVARAQQLCPDDPTPLWLRAQDRAGRAYEAYLRSDLRPQEHLAGALDDLHALQRQFPRSPLGYAGEADLLLDRADSAEKDGLRPFQARQWRREALQLYQQARAVSDDPALLAGEARALSELDRHDEAESALAQLPADVLPLSQIVTHRVRVRQAAGDWQGVLTLLSAEVVFPDGREVSRSARRLPGYGRLRALATHVWDASYQPEGGADTQDVAFIPQSRNSHLTDGRCLEQAGQNALLLLGRAGEAGTWAPTSFKTPLRSGGDSPCDYVTTSPVSSPNDAQDLFRWAGDLSGARQVVDDWLAAKPDSYLAHQRAGEIAYLRGEWRAAVDEFNEAAAAWQRSDTDKDSTAWSLDLIFPSAVLDLQLSAAQQAGGDSGAAQRRLTDLMLALDQAASSHDESAEARGDDQAVRFYAEAQLGAAALAEGRDRDAVDHLSRSVQAANERTDTTLTEVVVNAEGDAPMALLRGAQESNLALALSRIGRHDDAIKSAEAALSRDPSNPIFLDTLAFSHDLAGDAGAAIPAYEAALTADSTSFVSANNLAVLVGKAGDDARARSLLRQVVATAPTYGIGWHNLGVAEARSGLLSLVSSQHALGTAARLDRSLRSAPADFVVDDAVYSSGLDISKPLPPDWSYASSAQRTTSGFLFSMIILVALRAAWSLGLDRVLETVTLRLHRADRVPFRLAKLVGRPIGLAVALGASIVVLAAGPVQWAPTWGESALLLPVVGSLVLLPIAVRQLMIRAAGDSPRQIGSASAAVIGLVAVPFGLTLAPYPGLADSAVEQPRRVVWAPAMTAGIIAVAFTALTVISAVPLARVVAMAAVALFASIMLPVRPFDGAQLTNRVVGLSIGAASILVAVAASAGWL